MARKALVAKAKRKPKFSTRQYNRCRTCGRARAYIRKFQVCRICFRELAIPWRDSGCSQGELVGGIIMISDPIADMLTRVRNASRAAHSVVEMPSSILKVAIRRHAQA